MTGFESPLFYLFLLVHLVSLVAGFGAVIVIDAMGFLWVRGRIPSRRLLAVADVTQRLIWIGWAGLVVSGSVMLSLKGFVDPLTVLKIFLVAMIGINGVALHFIKGTLARFVRYETVPRVHKYHIILFSVVSQIGWWGALVIGFMHRHIKHYWAWPASPVPLLLAIGGTWAAAVLIGHLWMSRYHEETMNNEPMSDDEFKKKLTPEQYRVMREGGTEAPFSGKYVNDKEAGVYRCAACGQELFSSDTKFESGTGWPSFTDPMNLKNVTLHEDRSGGMVRTEVRCARCGSHLGHVFDDGPPDKGGKRYCINSVCLEKVPMPDRK